MRPTALITGAGGFLGSHIAEHLASHGFAVIGIGRSDPHLPKIFEQFYAVNLPNESLKEILASVKPDLIVHAAGSASVESSMREPYEDFKNSADVTAQLLDSIRKHSPESHFVLLSSASVYGAPKELPISEETPLQPISAYGYHRLMVELLVQEAAEFFNLRATVLRIFSAYGERIRRQVVLDLCDKISRHAGHDMPMRGTGQETRDFIHASDVAQAVQIVFEKKAFETINVASGQETTISELAGSLCESLNIRKNFQFDGKATPGMPLRWRADIGKLRALGFEPRISFSQGVHSFTRWFTQSRSIKQTEVVSLSSSQEASSTTARPLVALPMVGDSESKIVSLDSFTKSLSELPMESRPRIAIVIDDVAGFEFYSKIISRAEEIFLIGDKVKHALLPLSADARIHRARSLEEAIDRMDVFFPFVGNARLSAALNSPDPDLQPIYLPPLFSEKESWQSEDPRVVCQKYALPKKFLVVSEENSASRTLALAMQAIKFLRGHNVHLPLVVCLDDETIDPSEWRTSIIAEAKRLGVDDLIFPLLNLTRHERIQIVRASLALVCCLGISGSTPAVEDARALGKTIFLAGKQQDSNPFSPWTIPFNGESSEELAIRIIEAAESLHPGLNPIRESIGRTAAYALVKKFSETFMQRVLATTSKESSSPKTPALHVKEQLDLSIVVATKNRKELLESMLASIPGAVRGLTYEVIVVEGASTDGTREFLAKAPNVQVLSEANELGSGRHSWPILYNLGFQRARGTWGMYASDDIVFEPGCFEEALRALAHAPSNIVGGIFYYRNVIAEHPWEFFGIDFLARGLPLLNYGLMNIDVFRAVGGLSSEYAFYCADADLSYKIAAQELILSPLPRSRVVHNNVLDMQKQVNLKGFEADAAVIKNRWNHLGEGEPLYPRRALWNPVLESVFEIALKTRTAPKDLNLLLQTIGLIQIGDQAASQQAFMRLAQSRLPQPVIEKLHQLWAAPAINRAAR